MKVKKLQQEQGIKPAIKQTSADARNAALEAKFKTSSQPKESDVKKTKEETRKNQAWGRNRRNSAVNCQEFGSKCKKVC